MTNSIFDERLEYALQNEKMDAGCSDVRQSLPLDALIFQRLQILHRLIIPDTFRTCTFAV